jgi:PAS domain S-box-containing protein
MNPPAEGMSGGQSEPAADFFRLGRRRPAEKVVPDAPLWGREILDRLVQGLAEAPVFLTDAKGIVTSVSPAIERLLGYSPSEIIGRPATRFGIGNNAELKQILEQLAICDRIAGVKMAIRTNAGKKVRCKLAASVVKDSRGRVAGIVGSLYDQKDSEDDVETSAKTDTHVEFLLDGDSSALIWLDINNRIVRWSAGAEAIFGYSEHEITGSGLSELIPDRRTRFNISSSMDDSVRGWSSCLEHKINAVDKNGSKLHLESIWRFLRDESGKIIGKEILLYDFQQSARRRMTESSMSVIARQAAAMIVHEVKNPLSSISLNVEMLGEQIDRIPDEESRNEAVELISSVISEVDRLKYISQEYLKQATAPHTLFRSQSLHETLLELQRFMQKEMEFHNIEFVNTFDPGMRMVCFNRERLKEAIMNLYMNSADAIPDGGKISTVTRISDGWAEILISDTGPGVSESDIDRLFTPFFTTKKHGTGLGLAIVEEILNEHGGVIEVCQEPEYNTFFLLRLPLHS